jgi:uncharacterized protein (TIGR03435 family)
MRGSGTMVEEGSETTQFYAISMALLANTILPGVADRPVVDKTGLTGYYDLALPTSALERAPPSPPATSLPLDIPSHHLEKNRSSRRCRGRQGCGSSPRRPRCKCC